MYPVSVGCFPGKGNRVAKRFWRCWVKYVRGWCGILKWDFRRYKMSECWRGVASLTVYGNYRSSANQTVTHLNSFTSRRVWLDSDRCAFLFKKKKYISYGLDCFTTSIRPLWRLQLPFRQGRPDFLFLKEWLSPCVADVYVLWRYWVNRRAVYLVCLKQYYSRNCKSIFQ